MAKQAVGPLVRYLDKAVLAICAGVFLFVVAVYGVVSPNQAGNPGEEVGPADIDPQIKAEAERLREKLLSAEPPKSGEGGASDKPFERPNLNPLDDLLAYTSIDPKLPSPVPPGLPVPDRPGEAKPTLVDLVDIIALDPPQVVMGRSGAFVKPPNEFKGGEPPRGSGNVEDLNWVTVYASFNRAEQERRFKDAGHGSKSEAIFLGIDIERRMQRPGGGWSDWAAIKPTRRMAEPKLAAPVVSISNKGVPSVPAEQRDSVDAFAELITDGKNNEAQCDLIRPLFLTIEYGDAWRYPRVLDGDVLTMDAEFQSEYACRYPECVVDKESSVDDSREARDLLKDAEDALEEGNLAEARSLAEAAKSRAGRDGDDRMQNRADGILSEIDKEEARAAEAKQLADRLPTQVLWGHDAGIGSLLSGRTYQYRVRPRLFNPFCGKPTLLKNPQQAEIVELVGPWSEPTDPVTIEPDTVIFAKSSKARDNEVKVEVFKWYAGTWLSRQFNVTVGSPIGEPKKVSTPRAPDLKEVVDFSTGSTVVDIDFNRDALVPNRRGSKLENVKTTALVYVDASGALHESLLDLDKSSATYKHFRSDLQWEEGN